MRITCPLCGPRDRREFYYYGDAVYADRPAEAAPVEAWDDYLHLRDNPAGETRDLWYHEMGCASWLVIRRDTLSHAIFSVDLLDESAAATKTAAGKRPAPVRKKPAPKAKGKPA